MIIDANLYWLPDQLFSDPEMTQAFLRCLPQAYDTFAFASRDADGRLQIRIEKPLGYENLNYYEGDYALEKQLKDMDAAHVDKAVMKLPGCQEWLTLEMCRVFNDAAALHARESRGRLIPLAVIPPYGDQECLDELDRCVSQLHMHGVQLSAHYGIHYLDDPLFRPMLKRISELNLPVYVHHTPVPVDCSSILPYNNLRRSFGRCQDQITAIGRELFSGMFAEMPNLKMIHSMLGGGYFTFKEMLMPRDSGGGRFETHTDAIRRYLLENIYFEMSHAQPWGRRALELAVDVLGADHIIYGSSYPVKRVWMLDGPEFVENLDLTKEERQQILGGNARKIYGIE